ncbi:hypothetical protein HHL23_22160 [Chryseobacterium sp. RP-3-3]|uniref:Uncharacterized protein n=1 Tax=Chryseobacterium antibioticum TaxID=2728847 RepID=A0A7Y0AS17_9FLAO|nr:hypothetical protein [Chryseobacterium antibioticum]NML72459.1 hypothetical protein [Chryseobacterium antibioticum]
MENKFYTIFALTIGSLAFGQVGINTQNPQGVFNIDGAKNNAVTGTPTAAQLKDDFIVTASGSTGIGATPDASAILELNVSQLAATSKKGFLGPRVALTAYNDAATIPSPAVGLLVYNLGTAALTFQGYVYWDGTQWRPLDGRSLQNGTVGALNCTSATLDPISYTSGVPFAGTMSVPYTGGNAGIYPAQTIGPVNGLTATLPQGNFAQGSGTLNYTISGTPTVSSPTTTTFPLSIGGQSCSATVGLGKVLAPGEYQFFTFTLPATYVGLLSTYIGGTYDAILGQKVRLDLDFTTSSNSAGPVSYNPRLVNVFSSNIKVWYAALSSVTQQRRSNVLLAPGGYLETDNGIYLGYGDNMHSGSTAITATSGDRTGSDNSGEIETVDLVVDGIWYRITVFVSVDNLNDTNATNNIRRVFMTAQRMSN